MGTLTWIYIGGNSASGRKALAGAAKTQIKKLIRIDLGKRNAFVNAAIGDGPKDVFNPIVAVTGLSLGSSVLFVGSNKDGVRANDFYFGTRPDSTVNGLNGAYHNTMVWGLELTQDWMANKYPRYALEGQTQTAINRATGTPKIELQAKLNTIKNALNAYITISPTNRNLGAIAQRYDGTSFAYNGSWSKTNLLQSAIDSYWLSLKALGALKSNAENVLLQQAAAIEDLRKKAAAHYDYFLTLIPAVTGTPKITHQQEAMFLVQQDYVPQIAGFLILHDAVKATLKNQAEDRAIAAANAIIATWTLVNIDIEALRVTINSAATRQKIVDNMNVILAMPETQAKVDAFNSLRYWVLIWSAQELYNIRLTEINKVISALPKDLGENLWAELVSIQSSTDQNNRGSLVAGLDKLTNLLPRIDARLAEIVVAEEEEKIAIEEDARELKLALIEEGKIELKELQILNLMKVANDLMPQLTPELADMFMANISEAESFNVTEKLAFYMALIPNMKEAINITQTFETMTPDDMSGVVLILEDDLGGAKEVITSDIFNFDASGPAVEGGEGFEPSLTPPSAPAGNILPLAIAAGTLLFTVMG